MSSGRSLAFLRACAAPVTKLQSSAAPGFICNKVGRTDLFSISSSSSNFGHQRGFVLREAVGSSYVTGFDSTSRQREERRRDSQGGDKEDNESGWKWKLASCAGLVLAGLLKSEKFDIISQWFTVHAAQPIGGDGNNDNNNNYRRRGSLPETRRDFEDYNNNNVGTLKLSRRLQFNFIADVVEKVSKTVVCIEVKDHSMIDWFHGTPQTSSNGSGFIISGDGLILTNAHVVNSRGRTSISVHLHDGRRYAGHVEAIDPESDLALVRIKETGLPTLKLGNSSETRIGEWVVAIGSPLSLSNSVTAGVVSNVNRGAQELGLRNKLSYIQTDAAITFGNSGGPLVNLDGEAIGINSMKVTAGISFAIPSDYVKRFLAEAEERRKKGKVAPFRRYLGMTLVTLTEELAADSGVQCPVSKGAIVWRVVVGSPAYMAGIQPGDVIVKVNDKDVSSVGDVFEVMEQADVLNVVVVRDGKRFRCVVHPEDAPGYY